MDALLREDYSLQVINISERDDVINIIKTAKIEATNVRNNIDK